ncbi:hypothetical protein Tco_0697802 [Tanacetum coccineum]
MLVLWNPLLRRSVGILEVDYFDVFGFAVCPVTNEPTIVNISFPLIKSSNFFTLSSKKWTEIQCLKPCRARESIKIRYSQVVIGSCIYRAAYEKISLPDGSFRDRNQYMIVSFDLIAKIFRAIDIPDRLIYPLPVYPVRFNVSKLKGSLVIIPRAEVVKVWKMEPDCSVKHLFTINTPCSYISGIVGFKKNGELVVETQDWRERSRYFGEKDSALEVYDSYLHHINNIGFSGQNELLLGMLWNLVCDEFFPVYRRVEALVVDGMRRRGRPKLRWEDRVKLDMKELLLSEDMPLIE